MPKALSQEYYLKKADETHTGFFTYDMPQGVRADSKIRICCPFHGWFEQRLANHLAGAGCPTCSGRGVDWLKRFKSVHSDTYDYSKVAFTTSKNKVEIVCKKHGSFFQTPENHYRGGQGCPQCKGDKIRKTKQMPISDFIKKSQKLHNNYFTYTGSQFSNMLTDTVEIQCPLHGVFSQNPVNHLAGKIGCRKCNNTKSSGEETLATYVGIFAKAKRRDKTLIAPKELDVYFPDQKIAIEYCGMYWHSCKNQEQLKQNKNKHYDKYLLAQQAGVRLITVYESEWINRQPQVKRLLRNVLGKSKGRVMARKCDLALVSHEDARDFFEKYHVQGGSGSGKHYGLFWKKQLVACMRFTFGANDRGAAAKKASWTLSRYATRLTVTGGASRLFKAFVKEESPLEVKSFSDNRYFSGDMYRALGFVLEKEISPDYQIWSRKLGLLPKSHYQRRNIPSRLREHGVDDEFDPEKDSRTELKMTFLMGAGRVYDCGKKRWVWRLDSPANP